MIQTDGITRFIETSIEYNGRTINILTWSRDSAETDEQIIERHKQDLRNRINVIEQNKIMFNDIQRMEVFNDEEKILAKRLLEIL